MVYPTDINRNVLMYVEEARSDSSDSRLRWYLHGWSFDNRHGFGGFMAGDDYEGEAAIISETSKSIKFLYIGRRHSSRKSWGWWTETDELPEPPFLITNRLNTQLIYDGEIEIDLDEEGKKMFLGEINPESFGMPIEYLVLGSSGWFGEITTEAGSHSFHLLAYSDSIEQEGILNSEMISNFDVADAMDELMIDEEINVEQFKSFGRITRLIPQPEMSLSHV
jgi:hypothetical protein